MSELNSLHLQLKKDLELLRLNLLVDLDTSTTRGQYIRLLQHISHLDRMLAVSSEEDQ